jgi:predicted nucleotidyltransferase
MSRYIFSPELPAPYRYIHPLKLKKVSAMLNQPIPDYVERIYLFGSSLDLTCQPDSDIDLYFITQSGDPDEYDALHAVFTVAKPVDVLIDSPEGFAALANENDTVEHTVSTWGLCIYEKKVG